MYLLNTNTEKRYYLNASIALKSCKYPTSNTGVGDDRTTIWHRWNNRAITLQESAASSPEATSQCAASASLTVLLEFSSKLAVKEASLFVSRYVTACR